MTAPDPYSLPRDETESFRLDRQHRVYKENTGYLLHPRIAANLPHDAHIAEVGTGTGIWLRDVAAKAPAWWQLTGFDISADQFPSTNGDRCKYEELDILQPIPDRYKARFDVVHLRLLICGLTGEDWPTTAKNVLALLKPGGWIQWLEGDFARMQVRWQETRSWTAPDADFIVL